MLSDIGGAGAQLVVSTNRGDTVVGLTVCKCMGPI